MLGRAAGSCLLHDNWLLSSMPLWSMILAFQSAMFAACRSCSTNPFVRTCHHVVLLPVLPPVLVGSSSIRGAILKVRGTGFFSLWKSTQPFWFWLQISEVVNSMKDLISFEKKTGLGPIRMFLTHT